MSRLKQIPIAKWLKEVAYAVRDLVKEYGVERFEKMVLRWADERTGAKRSGLDLPLMRGYGLKIDLPEYSDGDLTSRTLPEMYVVLAVIHDVICPELGLIDPLRTTPEPDPTTPAGRKATAAGSAYWMMMAEVASGQPCFEDWEADCREGLGVALNIVKADLERTRERTKTTHTPDFISVTWFGTPYTFTKGNQAETVRVLWECWEAGGHSLSQETIKERIESGGDRLELAKVFRKPRPHPAKGYEPHPAWGTMIQQSTKGSYRLVPPEFA